MEIITLEKDEFKPTVQALSVPELLNLWKNVPDPEVYFLNLYHLTSPFSPYFDLEEGEKERIIHLEFPVDVNNPYYVIAADKLDELSTTPNKRAFMAAKKSYDALNKAMIIQSDQVITFGTDGNYRDISNYLQQSKQLMQSFNEVEKLFKAEVAAYGKRNISYENEHDYENLNDARESDLL